MPSGSGRTMRPVPRSHIPAVARKSATFAASFGPAISAFMPCANDTDRSLTKTWSSSGERSVSPSWRTPRQSHTAWRDRPYAILGPIWLSLNASVMN
jgi:hypothetical protein